MKSELVNSRTDTEPHRVLITKGKDKQLHLNSHRKNIWQAEFPFGVRGLMWICLYQFPSSLIYLAALPPKGGKNSVTQT